MKVIIGSLRQNRKFFTHPKRIAFLFIASFLLASFFLVEGPHVHADGASVAYLEQVTDSMR